LNLVQNRGDVSISDRAHDWMEWNAERWLLAVEAGACRRRWWPGLTVLLGGSLAWWAVARSDESNRRRVRLRAAWPKRRYDDSVVEALQGSFSASDAPSCTRTGGNTDPNPGAHGHRAR